MRVLIVDDYPGLVELYDLALRSRGFEVEGASTAGQAMTLAASLEFDAAVLDCELPDGSGLALAERLRNIPAFQGRPIVGMSCHPQDGERERFDGFLEKPFHPKRLAALLRRLTAREARVAS